MILPALYHTLNSPVSNLARMTPNEAFSCPRNQVSVDHLAHASSLLGSLWRQLSRPPAPQPSKLKAKTSGVPAVTHLQASNLVQVLEIGAGIVVWERRVCHRSGCASVLKASKVRGEASKQGRGQARIKSYALVQQDCSLNGVDRGRWQPMSPPEPSQRALLALPTALVSWLNTSSLLPSISRNTSPRIATPPSTSLRSVLGAAEVWPFPHLAPHGRLRSGWD